MIDLTAKIDSEQAKRAYEGLKQTAKRATSSMINDFELLDATVRRFTKTLGGVGGNMAFPALYSKIKQAQSEFNKLGGYIISPEQTIAASNEVNELIATIDRLDKAISTFSSRSNGFDTIVRSMREMITQADAFMGKISTIQQSAAPIPNLAAQVQVPSNNAPETGTAAYRELLVALEDVAGSKRENILLIEQLKAKNRELKTSIDALNKTEKDGFQLSEGQLTRRGRIALEIEENNQAIKNYRRELREQIKVDQSATTSINEMIASLDRLRTIYASLNERTRQSPLGLNLKENIEELESRINGMGVAMQSQTDKVGYYASGFNGLSFQIQQVARELPSLAYGPQVFFAAISNNLPMLTDEISRARIQYNELIKSGQKATPVWKQMLSSIASWQTLMVAGLTILTLYGKEIVNWTSSLFKGKKALDTTKIAMEQFHAAMIKGTISAQDEITKLNLLYQAAIDAAKPYEERTRAVKKLQEEYPAYFGNMDSELIMTGNLKSAYDSLKTSIIEVARARAASDKITENEGIKLSIEGTDEYNRILSYQKRIVDLTDDINKLKGKGILDSSPIIKGLTGTIEGFQNGIEKASETITEKLKLPDEASEDVRQYIASLDEANKKLQQQAQIPYTTVTSSDLNKEEKERMDAAAKAADEAAKAAEAKRKEIADAELAATKALYDAETELKRKQIADKIDLMKFDLAETLNRLEEQAKAEEAAGRPEAAKTIRKQKVVVEQSVQVDIDAEQAARSKAEAQAMNEYLAQYGDYLQKRKALADLYAEKIANAETKGEKMSLGEELKAKYAELDREAFKTTSAISKLFSDMSKKSVGEMRAVADEAERMLDFITSGEYDENNAWGISKETFDLLSKSPKELEAIKDGIAEVRNEADQAENAFNKMGEGLKKIFSGDLKGGLESLMSGLGGIKQASDFLADSFSNLGDAFGSDALNGIAEGFKTVSDVADSTMKGISAGFAVGGPIGGAIGGAIGLVSSLASAFARIHDKKNERRIQRLQEQVDVLEKSYDKLGRAIDKAYAHDAAKLIEDQNKMLEQQKVLIQNQMAEEEAKKNTDDEKIKQYQDRLDEINNTIEDNVDKINESLTGVSFDSLYDSFLDTLLDMDSSSEDFADNLEKYLQKAILNSMLADKFKDRMKKWYEAFAKANEDGNVTQQELDRLKREWNDMTADAIAERDALKDAMDWKGEADKQQQATSKGFQTMSQDTGNELNGRFTVMTDIMAKQLELQKVMKDANLAAVDATFNIRDLVNAANGHLQAIRNNTNELYDIRRELKTIRENTAYLK